MHRPYWKGYLKLALVSCPIALHAAERIAFRQINKVTQPLLGSIDHRLSCAHLRLANGARGFNVAVEKIAKLANTD